MKVEELIRSGALYSCTVENDDPEMAARRMACKELLFDFNNTRPSEIQKRDSMIRRVFAEMGENCYLEPPVYANWGNHVHVGNNFYANFSLTLVDDADIYIGNDVMIAPNVVIATAAHPINPDLREQVYQYNLPVHIGNRVWIGAGAIILPGVTIGDNSVIGAGSVVTKDIPAGVVAVGNPCRVMRTISAQDKEYYYKNRKIEL